MAAGAYQARIVVTEPASTTDHDIRLQLAQNVLTSPNIVVDRLVTIVGTDPDVASKGNTPELVGEALVLSKVADVWTTLAKMMA